jgi:predicted O-methyltransferase YrrM
VSDPRWAAVDRYVEELVIRPDGVLAEALRASDEAGLPPAHVSATQGRLLELLARLVGATRIVEIGTLAGYSTIWLARALPAGGRLVSLELDPAHAEVARSNLERAGLGGQAEVRVGPALEGLQALIDEAGAPFDLAFIDADKAGTPAYFERSLRLVRPGGLIVADNVVRGGALADPADPDERVRGVRRFHDLVAAEPRVSATTIQTVGVKGYDGFTLALVEGR